MRTLLAQTVKTDCFLPKIHFSPWKQCFRWKSEKNLKKVKFSKVCGTRLELYWKTVQTRLRDEIVSKNAKKLCPNLSPDRKSQEKFWAAIRVFQVQGSLQGMIETVYWQSTSKGVVVIPVYQPLPLKSYTEVQRFDRQTGKQEPDLKKKPRSRDLQVFSKLVESKFSLFSNGLYTVQGWQLAYEHQKIWKIQNLSASPWE